MSERVGQQLGNYRLLRLIGRGSWASVYLGEHLHLHSQAAIKVLHTHLTSESSEQLRTEALMLARLLHPHIVRVFDFDVEDGIPFLVMEYAPNGTLRKLHPQGTGVPQDTIVSYVKQVAEALHYLHQQKLIHRDIKPESMLLGRNNEILLSDFGLAIIAQSSRSQQTQEAAGSVTYMAPEQLRGKPRPASDQYALAVVVYEWLSGAPPFSGSIREIANQHLSVPPPSLPAQVPTISPAIERVLLQALAKDPQQRFVNVQAFALALEEAFNAESPGRTLLVSASELSAEGGQARSSLRNLPTGTVTLLLTDIEGSTHLLQQLGGRYADVLAECRHLLRTSFQEWNGYEVDTQGDAFFVAFARATDAVLAAVDAQRALATHPWPESVAVRVRMGLHTGEPQLSSEGYVGLDVHRAARIMRAGHGGQVLLSQTTCNLVEQDLPDDVTLRDLGEYRLKDLGRPRHLFQLEISGISADFPALKTLDMYPHNLPVQHTPFIGREQEVTTVCDLLRREDVRLLTLTGPGGTGKTRLALQVAAELCEVFADGVFFVNLAPISDPALVVSSVAEALGMREWAGQSLLERLRQDLRQKQVLLLLDNFEQVASAAVHVMNLLDACPKLKIMVTSREVQHVRAEHEFPVPPLALPDPKHLPDLATLSHYAAVALFIQRAQAIQPDFQMTNANARAIAEICARVDGLPLAIELAAARIKLLPPQALLRRIDQRLAVLTSTSRDVPTRQQTLRNTIGWSYNLLNVQEQQLFRRLSIFVSGCTIEAVEAVCATPGDGNNEKQVLDEVASLIDKSLLQQTEQEGEEPRLIMLETIREYGLEVLAASGEMEAIQQAHADYYLRLAEEAEPALTGIQSTLWLERLEREYDNLRAVMRWLLEQERIEQRREMALRLGGALLRFWQVHGHWSEGWNFLEWARAESAGVAVPAQVKALMAAAYLLDHLENDTEQAHALYEESLLRCRELGDTAGMAHALLGLGEIAGRRGHLTLASSRTEGALALCREVGDKKGIARSLNSLADIVSQQGAYARAISLNEESLALFRALGDRQGIAWSLNSLAGIISQQGKYARAISLNEESLALFKALGDMEGIIWSLFGLARPLFLSQGDPAQVHTLLEEGLALCQEVGHPLGIAWALSHLGEVVLRQGDAGKARLLLEESLLIYRQGRDQWGIAESLSLLGRVEALEGDPAAARPLYEESLASGRQIGVKNIASCLEGLAGVVATQGELTWAAELWGTAEALREAIGTPIPPVYRADYESALAAVRAQLGEKAFTTAWAEGRAMTPEQALAVQGKVMIGSAMDIRLASTPPVKSPTSLAGLTAREVEVLRLLATGLTDAQIAEQLVLSLHTVHAHLRTIYSKLGVTSRSAATRYAFEQKLV